MANNKIVYGDQTLIDLTSDTVTPETLAMGETAHSASGAQIIGTMSPSGPTTTLTPSNSDPVSIVDGTDYTADGNGYAIESYDTIFPSALFPERMEYGKIYKATSDGYAIGQEPHEIYPNNDNPPELLQYMYYQPTSSGYAIESYRSITPSNQQPVRILAGDMDYNNSSGYAIESFRSITPSNTSPVAFSSNEMIQPMNNGYGISGYTSVAPSASGTYFESGMKKMSSSGYAYSSKPSFNRTVLWTNPSTSTSTSTEFAAQDITLSQSIDNFPFICIHWEHGYGSTITAGDSIWYTVDLKNFSASLNKGTSSPEGFFGIFYRNSSSTSTYYWFLRNVTYNSSTSLHISNCWRMVINTSGTNTRYNSRIIPKVIYGCKVA